jgi:hypothetical protein
MTKLRVVAGADVETPKPAKTPTRCSVRARGLVQLGAVTQRRPWIRFAGLGLPT